jgi:hypothetical protein
MCPEKSSLVFIAAQYSWLSMACLTLMSELLTAFELFKFFWKGISSDGAVIVDSVLEPK